MNELLTHAASQIVHWTHLRDDLVRQERANGASLRAIGEAAGLSHTAIAKILERGEA